MSSIFRLKLAPAVYRTLVLEAHRFSGPAALAAGIVDGVGGLDEVLELVQSRKLTTKAKTGIYGILKAEMYRESVSLLSAEGHKLEERKCLEAAERDDERKERGQKVAGKLLKGKL